MGELLRFFLPLAAASMMMMLTHSVVNAALARTSRPETFLAAHALAMSMAVILESPVMVMRQVTIALATSAARFHLIRQITGWVAGACLTVAAVIAYTPVGPIIFGDLFGAPEALIAHVLPALRVLMLMPLTSAVRGLYQGLLTRRRATLPITWGMAARVVMMSGLAWAITTYRWLDGAVVGAVIFLAGMATEGLVSMMAVRSRPVPSGDWHQPGVMGYRWTLGFYAPLMLAGLLASLGKPIINSGLARIPQAAPELAAFTVASALAWIVLAPCQNVHQTVMVYHGDPTARPVLRRFAIGFALVNCAILAGLAWSPVGPWLLIRLLGVPGELVVPTLRTLRILVFLPLVLTAVDYHAGRLLQQGQTRVTGLARMVNVGGLALVATILIVMAPGLGASIGPLAQFAGGALEVSILVGMGGGLDWSRPVSVIRRSLAPFHPQVRMRVPRPVRPPEREERPASRPGRAGRFPPSGADNIP